jgi:hypothetical protein
MSYLDKIKAQLAAGLEKPKSARRGVDQAEKRRSNFEKYLKAQKELILSHKTPVELHGRKKSKRLRIDFWKMPDGTQVFEPRYGSSRVYITEEEYQVRAETAEGLGEIVETLILATRDGELDEALQKASFKKRSSKITPDTTPDTTSDTAHEAPQNKSKSGGHSRGTR